MLSNRFPYVGAVRAVQCVMNVHDGMARQRLRDDSPDALESDNPIARIRLTNHEDWTPHHEDWTPHHENSTSHHEDSASHHEDSTMIATNTIGVYY